MTSFGHAIDRAPTAAAPFTIEIKNDSDRVRVCPQGELDLATSQSLERTAVHLLEHGTAQVVIDLRGLTFIDSMGIRALVTAHRRARELGARMEVILGDQNTRRVLEITGLLDYLDITGH